MNDKTKTGLYLPPTVQEKEQVSAGYVIKVGPGIPIPSPVEEDEPWKKKDEKAHYIPLQAEEGDLAIFMSKSGIELEINKEPYIVIPQGAILLLYRDND